MHFLTSSATSVFSDSPYICRLSIAPTCVGIWCITGVSLPHGDWLRQPLWSWWGRRGKWLKRSRYTRSAKYCISSSYHIPGQISHVTFAGWKKILIYSSFINVFSSNHCRRWCQAICRNMLDWLTDSFSRRANTHSHTPRGKQRNTNPWGWCISTPLFHFLCTSSSTCLFSLLCHCQSDTMEKTQIHQNDEFPSHSSLRCVARVIFSGCFVTDYRWIKDTFQERNSSSFSFFSSFFTINFAHDAVHRATIHAKVMWVRSVSRPAPNGRNSIGNQEAAKPLHTAPKGLF